VTAKSVPAGDDWVHEVKFDGHRVQATRWGSRVLIFRGNGHDFTDRFPSIAQLLLQLPARAAVLDTRLWPRRATELRACVGTGWALHLWAFDLLAFNDRDLRAQSLVKRPACLQVLLERFGCPAVSLSEPFEDGLALLRVAEQRGLGGVVSKRRDAPYQFGECRDWSKVKTAAWREANRERWQLSGEIRAVFAVGRSSAPAVASRTPRSSRSSRSRKTSQPICPTYAANSSCMFLSVDCGQG